MISNQVSQIVSSGFKIILTSKARHSRYFSEDERRTIPHKGPKETKMWGKPKADLSEKREDVLEGIGDSRLKSMVSGILRP